MRIAVVDPSRTVLKLVTQLLEAREHSVRCFTDWREALDQITADHDVDALITSMELASMSASSCVARCARLATDGRRSTSYCVVELRPQQADRSASAAAPNFISKPPAIEELYARLRAAERLGDMQRKLYKLAMTDPLTAR